MPMRVGPEGPEIARFLNLIPRNHIEKRGTDIYCKRRRILRTHYIGLAWATWSSSYPGGVPGIGLINPE